MRRTLLAVALSGLVLAGCSGDPEPPTPTPTVPVEPAWNPCSSLDPDDVMEVLGAAYSVRRGTSTEPVCTFVPESDGDPVVDINYNVFEGSLSELLKEFGQADDSTAVSTPTVAGASDARLIVTVSEDDTLRITGFVRNGVLVQLVNVLDPAPFDEKGVVADVRSIMADLAAGAGASGLTGATGSATPSSSATG